MTTIFASIKKYSRTEQVVEEIRAAILEGTLKTGDKLPPERELAQQFGVSRTSIREAVRVLSTYGLIKSVQGDGLYVTDQFTENVFDFLGHESNLTRENFRPLYRARLAIETGSLMANVADMDEEILNRLEEIIAEHEKTTGIEALQAVDAKFHITLISASRSPILTTLYGMLFKVMVNGVRGGRSIYPEAKRTVITEHKRILDAIKKRSRTRAYNALVTHLEVAVEMYEDFFAQRGENET